MIAALLALTLTLAPAAEHHQDHELPERLEAALQDLRTRDPEVAQEVQRALRANADHAFAFLEEHAEYLDALRQAPPALRALMVEQESVQIRVHACVDQLQEVTPKLREAARQGDEEAARELHAHFAHLEERLREGLEAWFELRQDIRRHELELVEREIRDLGRHLGELREGRGTEEGRELWLDRALAGGADQAREEIEAWLEEGQWFELEDRLRRELGEREHLTHEELEYLPLEHVVGWAQGHPELLQEVRRSAGPRYELGRQLNILRAFLLEHVEGDQLVLEPEPMADVQELVRVLIELEVSAGAEELEHLHRELEVERQQLERREEHRELILTLKFAELMGYDELFDW